MLNGQVGTSKNIEQVGLRNLSGVLCYRHSVFQALLHTPKFCDWLMTCHAAKDCTFR
jgi:hypothetical protein